jgi:hypothetical protein
VHRLATKLLGLACHSGLTPDHGVPGGIRGRST